ncbi:MAG: nuclear transport factor 2 family protein [Deltaproteobacteria bacterium]
MTRSPPTTPPRAARRTAAWISSSCLSLAAVGCTAQPPEILDAIVTGFERGDLTPAKKSIDPEYADPLGDRDVLLEDLAGFVEKYGKRKLAFTDLTTGADPSALTATLTGRMDLELVGPPTWKVVGPAQLEFRRQGAFFVRSGLLSHVRDIQRLMAARRAALEANDAEQMRPLLHPRYRDGDLDADDAVERLAADLSGVPVRLEVTNYRVELRGPTAHVDEHYILSVRDKRMPPSVARFTLARTAGRWKIIAGLYPERP